MMNTPIAFITKATFGLLFSSCLAASIAQAQTAGQDTRATTSVSPKSTASQYHPGVAGSAKYYYQSVWGIDNLLVRKTASGNLIRFSYRVVDPVRASALGNKRATPYLIGQRSQAVLQVPEMDKVGRLRQAGKPEAGKEYWMVFSNKGNLVKTGDRVNVVIGSFHADGLIIE